MAQLKDSVVSGNLRVTDTTLTDTLQVTTVKAPTTAGGTTYGPGTSGQVLKSNGSSVYWGADSNAVTGVKGNAESSYRTGNVNLTPANIGALPLSGGTMTGPLTMKGEQYSGNYGLNMNNSDIIGANRIIFADDGAVTEGLAFWRSSDTTDNFWIKAGEMYFTPNYPTATTNNVVLHTGNLSTYVKASSNNGKISVNGSDVTVYTHPTATAQSSGLYKITVNGTGHVTAATAAGPYAGSSSDGGAATSALELTTKSLTADTISTTDGSFVFGGTNIIGGINDWVGFQADAGNDRFQIVGNNQLMFRQNDGASASSGSWGSWLGCITPNNVSGDTGITVTKTTTTIGSGTTALTYDSGVKISHTNSISAQTSEVFKKFKYDAQGHITGVADVAAGDLPPHTHNYVPNTKAGVNAAINLLDTGSSTPVDGDYYISQYVGGGTTTTTYHRRPMSALASYVRTKLSVTSSGSGPVVTGMSYSSSTGVLTYTKGRVLSTSGGQWIAGRDNAPVLANSSSATSNSFYPIGAVKTNTGAWSIGALGNGDSFAFSFSTDTNYSGGTNATNNYYIGTDGAFTGTAAGLTTKTVTASTVDTTAGSFVFGGSSIFGDYSADWVGFQADAGNDRFQIIANAQLVFRQNDSSTIEGNWGAWLGCLTPNNVSGDAGITVTPVEVSYGTDTPFTYKSSITIGHSNSISAQTSEVFKKFKYDAQGHITGVAAVAKADITALGIPAQDTTYSAGNHLSLSSTTFSLASYCKTITDWNDAKTIGWYMGSGVTNAPSSAWWMGRVTAHNAKYCIQEVWQFTASTDGHKVPHKMRMYVNEVWGNWVDITIGTAVPENAVFTDANVTVTKLAASTADASYYATFASAEGTSGLNIMDSIKFNHTKGTTSAVGNSRLILGNSTASGTANNEEGLLRLYSPGTSYHTIKGASTNSAVDHTLPTTGGTILNTGTTGSSTTNGKVKINGSDVTVYTHPTATAQSSGLYKITVNGTGHVTGATAAGPYAGASSDGGAATSANTLALKSLAFGSTLNTTTGLFAYTTTGSIYGTNSADWVGMQIGSSSDRFQIMGSVGSTVLIRTNDNADGTISTGWSKWTALMTPASVVAGSGLTKTYGYFDGTTDSDIIINATIGHSNSVTAQSSTVFKKFSYDECGHITGVDAVEGTDLPTHTHTHAKGGEWIKARDNPNIYVNPPTTSTSYYPAIFAKTKDGGWSMGVLGGADTGNTLYVTYTTDANYAANNNTNTYQISFPKDGGTLALTKNHVAKSGDTMTGLLTMYREGTTAQDYPAGFKFSVKDTTTGKTYSDAYIYAYQDHAANSCGTNMVINPGGCIFIGAGESAGAHYSAIKANLATSEYMYLTADTGIYIQGNGGTIANRKGLYLDTGHNIVPSVADTLTNNVGSIGTETYRWGYMFATQFNGKLGQYSSAVLGANGRPTSANLTSVGDRTVQFIQSTSSMTTGKPSTDGYILNFDWDNTGHLQSQLFLANSAGINHIQFRTQGGSSTWENTKWITVLSARNSPAFNRIFDRHYRTPSSAGWVRILTIGSFNNNGRIYGMSRITITRTYSNNPPEILVFEVMHNYNTSPNIYFLKSQQQTASTKIFTNIRIVKSSDGKEQYVDIYHNVSTQNYVSIRYEIFEPYDMLDNNNSFPVTTPADGATLTVLSTTPASADIMRASVAVPSQYDNNFIYANSYWGFAHRDGTATAYMRTTSNGLLPYQSGNVGSGHSNIGTSSWYFSNIYVDTVNSQQVKIKGTGTYDGTISNANATADRTVILPDSSGVIALMNVILDDAQGVTTWDFSLDANLYRSFIIEVIMEGYTAQTVTVVAHKYYPSAPCSFMMHSSSSGSASSYNILPAWIGLCYNTIDTSTPTWQFSVGRASKAIALNSNGTISSVNVSNTTVIKMTKIIGLTN